MNTQEDMNAVFIILYFIATNNVYFTSTELWSCGTYSSIYYLKCNKLYFIDLEGCTITSGLKW